MATISKITQQKKDSERFNIFLDGQYAFSVHESILIKYHLTKGMELDPITFGELNYDNEINRAFNRALHYLTFRMRSEKEVIDRLKKEEFGDAVISEALVKLRDLQFVNDEQFAEAFVKTKINTNHLGPRELQRQLKAKGIDEQLIQEQLEELTAEDIDLHAQQLAEKIARKNEKHAPAVVKRKIEEHLLRKGYSYDIIKEAVEHLELSRDEDEWDTILQREGEKAWQRLSRKHSGHQLKMRVKQVLYQKGIPADKINNFIELKENEQDEG